LAWIKAEQRAPGELEGIDEMIRSIEAGDSILMTSAITRIEVLESTLTTAQQQAFVIAISRRPVQTVACSMRVADKAHELRDFYQAKGDKLTTPDAIHLATAIIFGADVFYTFDGAGGQSKPKRNLKLLPLNGSVANHPLRIERPMGTPSLFPGYAAPPPPTGKKGGRP
jgi:predicted nucleic acid-binding protein